MEGRTKGRGRQRTLAQRLVPLVGEVGEGGVADEVVEDEGAGMAGTTLPEVERGRTRIRLAMAIMIGNAAMTRRWPVLRDSPNQNCSFRCLLSQMHAYAFSKNQGRGHRNPLSVVDMRWSVSCIHHVSSAFLPLIEISSCNKGTKMADMLAFLGVASGERRLDPAKHGIDEQEQEVQPGTDHRKRCGHSGFGSNWGW